MPHSHTATQATLTRSLLPYRISLAMHSIPLTTHYYIKGATLAAAAAAQADLATALGVYMHVRG